MPCRATQASTSVDQEVEEVMEREERGGHEAQVPAERSRRGRLDPDPRELFQITAMGCGHKSCSDCLALALGARAGP